MEEANNNNKIEYSTTPKTPNTNIPNFLQTLSLTLNISNNYNIPITFYYKQKIPNFNNPFIYVSYFPNQNIPLGSFNVQQNNN